MNSLFLSLGHISKPDSEDSSTPKMFYLPQKPYLFRGNLREQIIYPLASKAEGNISDENAAALLELVNLSHLLDVYQLDQETNWTDVLSPGEQQLLSFARLLFHSPSFAILDEATSSLPEDVESALYTLCNKRNITLLSVGHRKSLKIHHKYELHLDRKEEVVWKLQDLGNHALELADSIQHEKQL
jgi:ABC-type uncharacterized transport system fused permease/ATPase subunit